MRTQAFDPYIADDAFERHTTQRVLSLDELLRTSDIVTLHVPLTVETRAMIGAAQLGLLRAGAIMINASRGEVADQQAALDALAAGALGGLAFDVFDPEPPNRSFPDDPRLILTPHIGGCTHEAKAAIGVKLWEKICAFYATA
jgi:phosphoglycerate dehydrogenase-like enzyme